MKPEAKTARFEVELARHSGFCYGVKEAIKLAAEAAASGGPTKTYGPLIHNPQEIARLEEEYGIEPITSLDGFRDATIVIRAHGVPPEDFEKARAQNLRIVDATCPFVVDVQEAAVEFCRKGYTLFIVGEEGHPEIRGIIGHVRHATPMAEIHVVGGLEEIRSKAPPRTAVVFQTTAPYIKYRQIENFIRTERNGWKIKNTICGATKSNQFAADELSRRVDVMIVIGGRNSGNTHRLVQLCAQHVPTRHIETPDEVRPEWFGDARRVGVTAGASTPDWLVQQVLDRLRQLAELVPG